VAVVFISPKQRQKVFFMGITAVFLLFLAIISAIVFLSGPKEVAPILVFNKPKVNVNIAVFDSEQFKNLEPFAGMEVQYTYTALTKQNKTQTGFISAVSVEAATAKLTSMGLKVSEVKEAQIGRDNPFTPYYQVIVTPKNK
jgi:hypothetical protein